MAVKDPIRWMNLLESSHMFNVFGEDVHQIINRFIELIKDGDDNEEVGPSMLPRASLRCLIGNQWLNDTFVSWMVETINKQSVDTLSFMYSSTVVEGRLKNHFVRKFKERHVKKLIVFLNVGRSSFSENPLYKNETYIGLFTDDKGTNYLPQHYTVLFLKLDTGMAYYGDSLAWCQPITLISDVDNWTEQLLGRRGIFSNIIECHDSDFTTDWHGHKCKQGFCSSNYPLQTCSSVCGPAILICGAIAAFSNTLSYDLIEDKSSSISTISCFKNISLYNDVLRIIFIKWYMTGTIDIRDALLVCKTSESSSNDQKKGMFNQLEQSVDESVFYISSKENLRTFQGYQWKEIGDKNASRIFENMRKGRHAKDATSVLCYRYKCTNFNCTGEYLCSKVKRFGTKRGTRAIKIVNSHQCGWNVGNIPVSEEDIHPDRGERMVKIHIKKETAGQTIEHSEKEEGVTGTEMCADMGDADMMIQFEEMDTVTKTNNIVEENDKISGNGIFDKKKEEFDYRKKLDIEIRDDMGDADQFEGIVTVTKTDKVVDEKNNNDVFDKTKDENGMCIGVDGDNILERDVHNVSCSQCPLTVKGENLYCFLDQSTKLRRKYDFFRWQHGSNYKGITTYKCASANCGALRYSWLCSGKCSQAETKDTLCCSTTRYHNRVTCLFLKYAGRHTDDCNKGDNSVSSTVQHGSLEDRAALLLKRPIISVSTIPEDLKGNEALILKTPDQRPGKKLHILINDGRSYTKTVTTNREISLLFAGEEKVNVFNYTCVGSFVCNNLSCCFYKRFNIMHQISVGDLNPDNGTCTSCSSTLELLPCSAKKLVAFQNKKGSEENEIFIQYTGTHTCLAKCKMSESTKMEIEDYFIQNPNTKPSIAWYNLFAKKIYEGASTKEIDELMLAQVNSWVMNNAKAKARKQLSPHSDNIDDVIKNVKERYVDNETTQKYGIIMDIVNSSGFCTSCNKVDTNQSNICQCKTKLVDTGKYVFLSSKSSLETMLQMNYGNTLYGCSCHVDHQSGRTKLFTTFEGVVYDPELRGIVNLFTFHMVRETEFHVASAFSHLNQVLKSHYQLAFKPHGFVSDEGGGLLGGLRRMYPDVPVVTDDFHFKQNCFQVVSREIGGRNDIITFLRFTQSLQTAASPTVYVNVLKNFYTWINLLESRKEKVQSFVEWWDQRRSHWATAFKNNDVEKHSLAESGNSMVARKNLIKNVAIDDCLRFEICQFMRHDKRLEALLNGTYKGGRGPSRRILEEREIEFLAERVRNYPDNPEDAQSVTTDILRTIGLPYLDIADSDEGLPANNDPFGLIVEDFALKNVEDIVCPKSPHKFPLNSLKKPVKKVGRPKNSKKVKVSLDDSFEESDIDDEIFLHDLQDVVDEDEGTSVSKLPRLHGKYKCLPKHWKFMEKKVEDMYSEYHMEERETLMFTVTKPDVSYETRIVTFTNDVTSCTCQDFQRKQNVKVAPVRALCTYNCKHIVFVMRMIGVSKDDVLLRQHHLSSFDSDKLLKYQVEWKERPVKIHPVTHTENRAMFAGENLTSAQAKMKEEKKCCWFASYYRPRSNRGRRANCSTNNREPHCLQSGQLCLRVEFGVIFKAKPLNKYMMKTEEKYFCLDINCVNSPKSTFTNPAFSNFKIPKIDDIDKEEINVKDHGTVERLFDI